MKIVYILTIKFTIVKSRKITRKTLDELRKVMPVLTEQEQREYIGKTMYFDSSSGNFLGKVGPSSEIRIVNSSTFESLKYCNDDSELYPYSFALNSVNYSIQKNIITSIAREHKINLNSGASISLINVPCDSGYILYGQADLKGNIEININSPSYTSANYYDLLMTLYHEKYHTTVSRDNFFSKEAELGAYEFERNSPEFQYASESCRNRIINKIAELKAELNKK